MLPLVARWNSASKLSSLGSKSTSPVWYKSSGLVGRKHVNSTYSSIHLYQHTLYTSACTYRLVSMLGSHSVYCTFNSTQSTHIIALHNYTLYTRTLFLMKVLHQVFSGYKIIMVSSSCTSSLLPGQLSRKCRLRWRLGCT